MEFRIAALLCPKVERDAGEFIQEANEANDVHSN